MNSLLIIHLCRHRFPGGRRCRGAAVRGRACCRHHLDARTRLHNMARARRLACIPRLRVPMTPRDLASNRAEVLRVVAAGGVDFATARLMLWAMDLTAATFPSVPLCLPRRANNPNDFYHVPLNPLFQQIYTENHSQIPENRRGRGYHLVLDLEARPGGISPPAGTRDESSPFQRGLPNSECDISPEPTWG